MIKDEVAQHVGEVAAAQVAEYLQRSGWRNDGELGGLATIWHRPEPAHNDAEIVLPLSDAVLDFRARMIDVFVSLVDFERRSLAQITKDIRGDFADHVRIRVFHSDVNEGTIPLNDGVMLNFKARDLMAAAAMSTVSKQRHFSGKRSKEASEYLESLRLGQTEIGSYVVNVLAPVPVMPPEQAFETAPMSRIVTENLRSGLEALSLAIERFSSEHELTVFDEAIPNGVSANMCDALVGFSGAQKQRGFEISITPSSVLEFVSTVQTFKFDVEAVKVIADASAYYKDDYVLLAHTIIGTIKRLDRPLGDEVGTVTVDALVGGVEKHVAIQLEPEEYLDAVNAHKQRSAVRCYGDLHVKARTATLLNPSGFEVLSSGDLFPVRE